MKIAMPVLACGVLIACGEETPPRKPKMSEVELAEIRKEEPGLKERCVDILRWGGVEAADWTVEECYEFDPPKRWQGLWFVAFESSRFCPKPAEECSDDSPGIQIWAEPTGPVGWPRRYRGEDHGLLFEVEFIGRRTKYLGHHGHLGGSQHQIFVDRVISIKERKPARNAKE